MTSSTTNESQLNPQEKTAAYSLASIYALRMLGLFMILPVFSLYASELKLSTPALTGFAIGAYGLTQAILQIPYGMLSDKFGRKPLLISGMLIFALGSFVAGFSDSIYGVILGRLLQGSGAVAAVLMASAADLTREQNRLKVMAIIGISIGFSFAIAMVAGSAFYTLIGVPGIFYVTGILALCAIAVIVYVVPPITHSKPHRDTDVVRENLLGILTNTQLLRLDAGVFILHMVLTASFLVIPKILVNPQLLDLPVNKHWEVYLPIMVSAMLLMVPFIILAESKRKMKGVFVGAIIGILFAESGFLWLHQSLYGFIFSLLLFFIAFNILEASLPSLVAKIAPSDQKGTAMGVYSSAQFFGAFSGGAMGGHLLQTQGLQGVFIFTVSALAVWLLLALSMKSPRYLSNYVVNIGQIKPEHKNLLIKHLTEVNGVAEASIFIEEQQAYLKVDLSALDRKLLKQVALQFTRQQQNEQ